MRKIATRLPFGRKNISKPVNTAFPYVTGLEQVGQTLTAGNGNWSGNPTSFTYTYQWVNSSTGNIAGQTSSTYVAGLGDLGFYVTVRVTATNAAGSNTSSSWNMSRISAAGATVPIISVAPAISSSAQYVGQALTVSNGTWSNSPTSYTYQWVATGTAITGATTNSYTPVMADLGKLLTVNVNAINGAGTSVTAVTPPPFQAVKGPILLNTALPAITGIAQIGQTLTASTGTWTDSPTSYAYQWNNGGSPIGGATNSTYVFQISDLGTFITVTVTAMNSVGASAPVTSLAFGLNISKPVNTAFPYVTGLEQVGQTLTAGNGSWSGNPTSFTYTYQWVNSSTGNIAGQTSSTYVAGLGDLGFYVTVRVTATNAAGSNTSSSWNMSRISAAGATVPIISVAPAISSSAQYVGQALTVSNGTWSNSPTSYTYQWVATGTAITGATTNSYTPVMADLGKLLTVNVNAINGAGTSVTAVTPPPFQAVKGPILLNTALPAITGIAQIGQTLTASTGTWTDSPTSYAYQWNNGGSPIGGATNSTYVFQISDLGTFITVTVTAMNSVGASAPVTSLAFGLNISKPVNTAFPYVTGLEQVGQTLTAGNGNWSGNPTSFTYTYQWVNSSTGNIAGQTSSTYVAGLGDLGFYVTVRVTATNAAGSNTSSSWNMSRISAAGATVPIISVAPAISSSAQYVGQALTVSNGTWSNSPTSYTYQWVATGTAITGATTNSYTPVMADLGKLLTVNVNAINGAGTSVTAVTPPPFQAVMGPILLNTALPAITGIAQIGQTLTASTGTWTDSPTSYAYQWNNGGSPIGGATNSTYVFQISDLGTFITVTVTAMNSVGASAPVTSLAFGLNISKPVNTAFPYVTGLEQVGQTLTAGNGNWSGNPTSFTYTYQWVNSSTGNIAGQTSSTYVAGLGDLGFYVTVRVTATNAAGSNTSSSWNMSRISAAGATVPIISVAPAISSSAQYVGQALTVSNGTWSNSPTSYTYQWVATGTAITGATTNSYTPVMADLGKLLTVNVNAINGAGTSVTAVTPPPFQAVKGPILLNTALPAITGIAQIGQTLTASTGTWTDSPTSYAYQWNNGGSPIGGATNSTYVFQISDLGTFITVTVTAMNSVGVSAPVTSLAFGLNISKPVNTAFPYVTGLEQVGQTLTAGNGNWSGNPTSFTYTYQWVNSSTGNIAGQTSSTYVAGLGDLGFYVTVRVTATNAAGSNTSSSWNMSRISAAGATVPIISVAPAISSSAQYVGQALTVSNGTWSNSPTSYTYQWVATGTAITGATTNSYTPVMADLGKLLTVNVNAINGAGTSVTAVTPPPFQAVMGPILLNTALPAITGIAQIGQTLTASTGTWTDSPTSYAYQWNNEGSPIGGATNSTYVLKISDLGALITVAVTAMSNIGTSAPVLSPLVGPTISTTVFYVANAGLDTNTGTSPASPWRTISQVNGFAFSPGTSVLFNRGDVWREQLSPTASGSAGAPIVFDAYGAGSAPLIVGSVSAANTGNWTLISGNLWKSNTAFPPVVGPDNPSGLNGFPHNNANDVGNLIWATGGVMNVGTTSYTLMTEQTDTNLITQCQYYFNTSDWKIHVYSIGNPATTMPGLELSINKVNAYFNNVSYITIQNFMLQYCAGSALKFNNTSNMTARDMTMQWCGGGNDGGNNVRAGNGADVQLNNTNIIIERCVVNQMYDAGITVQPLVNDQIISNVTFRNNVVTGAPQGLFQIITSGAAISNISIYNNTGKNDPSWSEGQRWGAGGSSKNGQQYGLFHDDGGGPSPTNYNNFNNVYSALGTSCSICGPINFTSWQGAGNMSLDYNLWSRLDGAAPQYCATGGSGNEVLSTWAAGDTPPQEVHGQFGVDPGFIAPGHLSPGAGSHMLNAGTNLYSVGVVWDYNRLPRPSFGPFTVGAIQNVGGF